jgi:hypothetical protein
VRGVAVGVTAAGVAKAWVLRRTAVPAARAALVLRKARRDGFGMRRSFMRSRSVRLRNRFLESGFWMHFSTAN